MVKKIDVEKQDSVKLYKIRKTSGGIIQKVRKRDRAYHSIHSKGKTTSRNHRITAARTRDCRQHQIRSYKNPCGRFLGKSCSEIKDVQKNSGERTGDVLWGTSTRRRRSLGK